jgi:uncharacterized protein (DUF924 family)
MKNLTNSILEFWFSDKTKEKWFVKDSNFDEEIRSKFLDDYNLIKEKSFEELTKNNKFGAILARIIILDQFPRNLFRNSKQSFATDDKALSLAKFAIENDLDQNITKSEASFIYMPFMHSENIDDQKKCIDLFSKLNSKYSLDYAVKHMRIIEKFARFPHRNEILKRESTNEELKFLKQSDSSF